MKLGTLSGFSRRNPTAVKSVVGLRDMELVKSMEVKSKNVVVETSLRSERQQIHRKA